MARRKKRKERILVLWNGLGEPEYEQLKEQGPTPLEWDPTRTVSEVTTVDEEIAALEAALVGAGFKTRVVNIEESIDTLVSAIRRFKPDAIFNLVEFFNEEAVQEAYVAGVYEMLGVPYTGAGPLCLMTCQRKTRTKALLERQGVPTPAWRRFDTVDVPADHGLRYPLIVKPSREDASGGIDRRSVVHDYESLVERVTNVVEELDQPALVERYIAGREIHVAMIGNGASVEVLPLLEFEFEPGETDAPNILTYQAKWDPTSPDFYQTDVQVPPREMKAELEKEIHRIARLAYRTVGCRDYARCDMRIDEDGRPFVLEVNPNPDLADGTGFMLCAENGGRTFEGTITELVEMALARGPSRLQPKRKKGAKRDEAEAAAGDPADGAEAPGDGAPEEAAVDELASSAAGPAPRPGPDPVSGAS